MAEPADRSDLARAVSAVVNECLGIREGEDVLVIANPATLGLGEMLRGEAGRAGADAVLAPTVQSLSHTASRKAASEAGARIATLPGVTEELLARVMSADLAELRRRGAAIADALNSGTEARLTCANGSDLRMGLEGRTAIPDAGELTAPSAFGNLPCGEGFISPDDRASEGTLVVDGSIATIGLVDEPVRLTVAGGRLTEASGPQGQALLDLIRPHGDEAGTIAELGIGTNEKAQLTGNVIEDEKILGTAHVAFGASQAIGGRIQVPVHLDCVVMKPTVSIDGTEIVRDGELLL